MVLVSGPHGDDSVNADGNEETELKRDITLLWNKRDITFSSNKWKSKGMHRNRNYIKDQSQTVNSPISYSVGSKDSRDM